MPTSGTPLSKTQYLRGLQCPKSLWLWRRRKDLLPPPSASQSFLFEQGRELGLLAQRRFPGGRLIEADALHVADALEATRDAASGGGSVLFEAAAYFDGLLVRPDILVKSAVADEWDLLEVKGSTEVKEVHLDDVALQLYVLEQSGWRIRRAVVLHVDRDYVRRGEVDPMGLFAEEDVTKAARSLLHEIAPRVAAFKAMLAADAPPEPGIGRHCSHPYPCEFRPHCWARVPEDSIYDLARVRENTLDALRGRGVLRLADIPEGFPLTPAQQAQVDAARTGEASVDRPELARFLAKRAYPLHFLDFETFSLAVPPYEGLRPFQQVPFQASVHVQDAPGAPLRHLEFLADASGDPRPALVDFLLRAVGPAGPVAAYNASFEGAALDALAEAFPERAEALLGIRVRLWDLAGPFRDGTFVHPAFKGSWSIKQVLPALVPGMDYRGLAIADGEQARLAYVRMMRGELSDEQREETVRALKEYCGQDTLAMAKLLDGLSTL